MKHTVLDLFAGAGGFSWGFENFCQFKVAMAVEIQSSHAATYKKNFPSTISICADISQIPGNWFIRHIGRPALVIGGPPCQGFSVQGKRNLNDPRLKMIFEFERVVRETEAPYFLMENVDGLILREMRPIFNQLCDRFSEKYQTRWQVLDAADYGIPQRRKRVFLMGARKGLPLPDFPEKIPIKTTTHEALSDLPCVERYPQLLFQETNIDFLPFSCTQQEKSAYAQTLGTPTPELISGLGRTRHCSKTIARYTSLAQGEKDPISRCTKLDPNGVAPTLLAGSLANRQTALRHIHYKYPRVLLVREGARLQSFPDYFEFDPRISVAWNQIGNAVPPLLSRQFAQKFAQLLTS